jgi:hypothetical protein
MVRNLWLGIGLWYWTGLRFEGSRFSFQATQAKTGHGLDFHDLSPFGLLARIANDGDIAKIDAVQVAGVIRDQAEAKLEARLSVKLR